MIYDFTSFSLLYIYSIEAVVVVVLGIIYISYKWMVVSVEMT